MFMVLLILNAPERSQEVLNAWDQAGASGVTILPSTGLGRVWAKLGLQEDVPLMPSLKDFVYDDENLHRTLITITRERAVVDRIIRATQNLLGDLNLPHTGILVVMPVLDAYGLDRLGE